MDLYGPELAAGASVASYVVEELRHRGPAATVYRARDRRSGKPVALKVLHLDLLSSGKAWKRFQQEVQTLRGLRHPHIVRCLGSGELWDGRPYLAMEWLNGTSLDQQLKARGPLTAKEIWAVAKQVGSALRAAHARGIVHRDLKAENVMVLPERDGSLVKLVDFGVAKHLDAWPGRAGITSTGFILGTLSCIAPEQIRGDPVDARTDIYAFGVLLYQMATGQLPFEASSRTELEEMHLYAPTPRPSRVGSFGPELDAVVSRCLEKRPAFRFENAAELLVALKGALLGQRRERPSLALGLFVEIQEARPARLRQEGSADTEGILNLAERHCRQGQLSIAVKAQNALLAIAPLPRRPRQARARREKVLKVAVALASELKEASAAACLRVGVRLHAAEFRPRGDIGEGELLALRQWTVPFAEQLLVSEGAADGLSAAAGLTRSHSHPGFLRVSLTA